MTVPVVLAIAGVSALFFGIWGSGIKAKDFEIPAAPPKARVMVGFVGLVLIGISIWLSMQNTGTTPAGPNTQFASGVYQQDVEVYADRDWQDAGMEVKQGEYVTIQYLSGEWSPLAGYKTDGRGCIDPSVCSQDLTYLQNFPNNIVAGIHATLIAQVGNGQIEVIGNERTFQAKATGRLALRINDRNLNDNFGSIMVLVKIKE